MRILYIDHVFSGVNFKKELPNEGLIKASKCKTCEVEDGSIRTDPETGEEKKVKLERCAKCRMVWYCGKDCQQQNWAYHKPNCTKSTVGVGLPVFIKVRKVTDRETLINTIKNASRFSIDYKWDDDSISQNKDSCPNPEPFEIDPYNMVSSRNRTFRTISSLISNFFAIIPWYSNDQCGDFFSLTL